MFEAVRRLNMTRPPGQTPNANEKRLHEVVAARLTEEHGREFPDEVCGFCRAIRDRRCERNLERR